MITKKRGGGNQKNCHNPEEGKEIYSLNGMWYPEWNIVEQKRDIRGKLGQSEQSRNFNNNVKILVH